MGQVLHGNPTAMEAVRRAMHNSQASRKASARRYGINKRTVVTRNKRACVPARAAKAGEGRP